MSSIQQEFEHTHECRNWRLFLLCNISMIVFAVYSQASREMVHETVSTTVGLVLTPTGPKVCY